MLLWWLWRCSNVYSNVVTLLRISLCHVAIRTCHAAAFIWHFVRSSFNVVISQLRRQSFRTFLQLPPRIFIRWRHFFQPCSCGHFFQPCRSCRCLCSCFRPMCHIQHRCSSSHRCTMSWQTCTTTRSSATSILAVSTVPVTTTVHPMLTPQYNNNKTTRFMATYVGQSGTSWYQINQSGKSICHQFQSGHYLPIFSIYYKPLYVSLIHIKCTYVIYFQLPSYIWMKKGIKPTWNQHNGETNENDQNHEVSVKGRRICQLHQESGLKKLLWWKHQSFRYIWYSGRYDASSGRYCYLVDKGLV